MVKACIITYDEYINIPYVKIYEDLLHQNSIIYDMVLWNRSGNDKISKTYAKNLFLFKWYTKKSKILKILPFLLWRRFVKKILQENHYDFLVVCTTIPAVLLYEELTRKFKNNYLLDIRDFTYENNFFYRYLLKNLVLLSGMTVISSRGFFEWLPCENNRYVITHNITNE